MPAYLLSELEPILKGKLISSNTEDISISQLLTDSRKLSNPQSTLFFALKSKRNDGNRYIEELYKKGVRCFVVNEDYTDFLPQAHYFLVKNTLWALQSLATFHRKHFNIPVLGITGSNGKTIVKDWVSQLLSSDLNVVSNPKSFNSQIGVPLSVWQMSSENEFAIFEAGISEPSEMLCLQNIIRPTLGIFTNIGQAHDENFLTRGQKIAEKLHLFTHVKTLIYNIDCADIHSMVSSFEAFRNVELFTWGTKPEANIRIVNIQKAVNQSHITVQFNNQEFSYEIPFIDSASIENSMHCLALLCHMNYTSDVISQRMKMLTPIAMRLELKEGINNCSIINDSYSSDLNSLSIALEFLQQQQQHKKRTLILSDILQSGKDERELYEEVANMLVQKNVDFLIGIGESVTRQARLFDIPKQFFNNTADFINQYSFNNFNNETILLKGARVFEFEKISNLLQKKSHETILEINLNAIEHNLNFYKSLLNPKTKVMAMVKAFSYGAGSVEIANILQFNNVDYLTVAYADEGVDLRKFGIQLPIMVMNPEEQSLNTILKYDLEPDVYSIRILQTLIEEIKNSILGDSKICIHIELDTGMHRLGMYKEDLPQLVKLLKENPQIEVKSVFSHLAAADEPQFDSFTRQQIFQFEEMVSFLKKEIDTPFLSHILNTAGISRFTHAQFDMVRLGIGLYGISSDSNIQGHLQNVSILKTKISQIKKIQQGESVGYSRKWVAQKLSTIAVIPIGYADGLNRKLGNGVGSVQVNGQNAPIIGNICMDMCMIDITDIDCKETDEVIVFGSSTLVQNIAESMNTIAYEVFTSIPQRVKRIYYHE